MYSRVHLFIVHCSVCKALVKTRAMCGVCSVAQVDELLSLQHLEGRDMDGKKVHDEHLFIIVHQGVYRVVPCSAPFFTSRSSCASFT